MRSLRVLALATPALLFPLAADAAGLARPNIAGARPVGLGGAFVAVAEDPSAIWYNPAGLAQVRNSQALVGLELAKPTFTYNPSDGQCGNDPATSQPRTNCPKVESSSGMAALPVLGASTRFASAGGAEPSRLAIGFLFYNSYGGAIEFDRAKLKANNEEGGVIKSTLALLEAAPSVAYRVNEQFYLGAAFRIGIGLFNVENAAKGNRANAKIDSTGAGVGYSIGAILKPIPQLRLGLTYRSQLSVEPSGSANIESAPGSPPITSDVKTKMPWPQAVVGGFAVKPIEKLLFSTQLEWVNWSSFQAIAPAFQKDRSLDVLARYDTDFKDSWAAHVGLEYTILDDPKSMGAAVRVGYARDSNAIPDSSIDRQYVDGEKNTVGGGGTVAFGSHNVDFGVEVLFGGKRNITCGPDRNVPGKNTAVCADVLPELRTAAPGSLSGSVLTGQLSYRLLY